MLVGVVVNTHFQIATGSERERGSGNVVALVAAVPIEWMLFAVGCMDVVVELGMVATTAIATTRMDEAPKVNKS